MELKFNALRQGAGLGSEQDEVAMFMADTANEIATRGEAMPIVAAQGAVQAGDDAAPPTAEIAVTDGSVDMTGIPELNSDVAAPDGAVDDAARDVASAEQDAELPVVKTDLVEPDVETIGATAAIDGSGGVSELGDEESALIEALAKRIRNADWYYAFSDDAAARAEGARQTEAVMAEVMELAARFPAQVRDVWYATAPAEMKSSHDNLFSTLMQPAVDHVAGPDAAAAAVPPDPVAAGQKAVSVSASPSENSFAQLLSLSAGKITADEIKDLPKPMATASRFTGSAPILEDDPDADDLAETLKRGVESAQAAPKGEGVQNADSLKTPIGANAAVPGTAVASGAPQLSATLGGALGRAVGGAVATPFIALTSAAKHLSQRFGKPLSALPAAPSSPAHSMAASVGRAAAIANTLEKITSWKADRIEKAASEAARAATELTGTEEFVMWEDSVRKAAAERNCAPAEVIGKMHEDESLASLKDGMDDLWRAHPEKVDAYRKASEDFVRNINGVIKEFPNSDDATKERVANAMKGVETKTEMLPGFGAEVGEYRRTLAERVREIAKMIEEFVNNLVAKLTGKPAVTNELTA